MNAHAVARPSGGSTTPRALAARFDASGLDWIVPQWPAPAAVQAFVTTRNGGVSVGTSASLDLGGASIGSAAADEIEAIAENRRRVEALLPATPFWLQQVHGADVAVVDAHGAAARASARPPLPHADAVVTRECNVVLAVRVADCLPVLLADRRGSVIGVAHAGWRGLAAGVLENAVAAMNCEPARIVAWFGPAIGQSAFEVGVDVRDAFVQVDIHAATAFAGVRPGKWHADLEALARMRLARAGVTSIHGGGMCTASDPARFFSFRRDRTPARMAAFVWRTGTAS
jgi:YfiH family protein